MRRSVSHSPNTKLELERALQAKRVAQVLKVLEKTEIAASNASKNNIDLFKKYSPYSHHNIEAYKLILDEL